MTAVIEARGIRKRFGKSTVLEGIDLVVDVDEVVALIGPSGSGKSTFLRCLNLLETPDGGELFFRGERVDHGTMTIDALTRHRTSVGMVFQHFHLFPHRTAVENVMEGLLSVRGMSRRESESVARDLLSRVGLESRHDAWPSQLSGGEKQRVAIARALAMEPEVLLLDEVTSALDVEMIAGINDLLDELARGGMTMVVVTHDLGFARRAANRICFMDGGHIVESGSPEAILDSPVEPRTREFVRQVSAV